MTVRVTAGIPAYNEEKTIKQLLRAIIAQKMYGSVLQEIFVDTSGSTDGTNNEVIDMLQEDPRIKLISGMKRLGKSEALNSILRQATGDLVVFIDGDVVLATDCISALISPLVRDEKVGVTSGRVLPLVKKDNIYGFASHFVRELHHELCTYLMKRNMTPKVDGSFYAIRKNVVGGFPFYVVSDDEYASLCAQNRGFVVVYVPEALVYAKDPNSFNAFIKWQQRITVGQMYIRKFFNYSVPTTKVSILFVISVKLIKKHWRNVLPILTLLSLVGISVIFAFKTFLQHKIPYVYN